MRADEDDNDNLNHNDNVNANLNANLNYDGGVEGGEAACGCAVVRRLGVVIFFRSCTIKTTFAAFMPLLRHNFFQ